MITRFTAGVAFTAFLFAVVGIFFVAAPALAYPHSNPMSSNMTSLDRMFSNRTMIGNNESDTMTAGFKDHIMSWINDTSKNFGIISSIQNDEDGEPAWVITGHWMMTNDTATSNETETGSTEITKFHAGFYMTMLDGSGQHTHKIYNFTQNGNSATEGNVTTITGTSTVTLSEGPVSDVETEITISQGNVIAIYLDQEATDNHFGDTPIYGIIVTPEIMHHAMSQMMNNTTTTASSIGGMTEDHCDRIEGNANLK